MAHLDRVSNSTNQDWHHEQCVLLIPAPADGKIYRCYRALAEQLASHITCERLWLEHELPLSSDLCAAEPSGALARVLSRGSTLIGRILLEAGGLRIEYVRSGGHDPFRESFFDEVLLTVDDALQLSQQCLQDVLMTLHLGLDATALRGSPLFTELFENALQNACAAGRARNLNIARQ